MGSMRSARDRRDPQKLAAIPKGLTRSLRARCDPQRLDTVCRSSMRLRARCDPQKLEAMRKGSTRSTGARTTQGLGALPKDHVGARRDAQGLDAIRGARYDRRLDARTQQYPSQPTVIQRPREGGDKQSPTNNPLQSPSTRHTQAAGIAGGGAVADMQQKRGNHGPWDPWKPATGQCSWLSAIGTQAGSGQKGFGQTIPCSCCNCHSEQSFE